MVDNQHTITAEQVETYLTENADFFLRHPQALESLQLDDTPQGTISLAQRQIEQLQEKNQQAIIQLHSIIETARDNTALQARTHQLCLRLMDTTSFESLLQLLMTELKQEFKADEVTLRWFYSGPNTPSLPENIGNILPVHSDDEKLIVFEKILAKNEPVCGRLSQAQKELLFADKATQVQSVACIPLGHEPCAGLLAIASFDEAYFHADMATDYLRFLGEVTMRLFRPYHDFGK